ncbi:hypothetical protein G5I_06983 [Acromyrmex echinatior]|uniref:Uncharacterized protein n=1 Tax=Acromyrmex echinatior TaxID=103372 RepID=F4WME9_ACREC|nr:hypothetical protein G5I_06983 [Acromyrmex echinatior]
MISREDQGGSGGDSERVPGRLGPRAQSPPKPCRDRFVGAVAGEGTRKSALTRGARSGGGSAVSWWCTLPARILKATRSSGGTQETVKIHRRPEMSESQGFDQTIDKRDNTTAKCRKVNLTFGGLLVKDALIVKKTVRRSSSSEFLVWGYIT